VGATAAEKIDRLMAGLADAAEEITPPPHQAGRLLRLARMYLAEHPELLGCDRRSLRAAVLRGCQLGLEIGGPSHQAALVAYKRREEGEAPDCQLLIEYRGRMELCHRGGLLEGFTAGAVYEGDHIEFEYGTTPYLTHSPALHSRGALIGAYAVAQFSTGGRLFVVIDQEAAAAAMADSPGSNKPSSLWKKRPAEMWTKTALLRLCNRIRQTAVDHRRPGAGPAPEVEGPA
jgi:recombination protein RecT